MSDTRSAGDAVLTPPGGDVGRAGSGGRYFVTVIAGGREGLLALRALDLDLFKPTAREAVPTAPGDPGRPGEFTVDGLLTLEEVGGLVSAGYRVLVHEDAAQKARGQISPRHGAAAGGAGARGAARATPEVAPHATEAVGFEEWLQGMQEPQRKPARRKRA